MQKIEKLVLSTNFPIGPVNAYLLFGEKLTLIDTGLNRDYVWKELNDSLYNLGLTLKDIEQIVLTHHHNDHTGLLHRILEKHPTISVHAHKDSQVFLNDKDYLIWSTIFFEKLFYEFGLPKELIAKWASRTRSQHLLHNLTINQALQEGDMVPGLPGWQVIETLGHSQDHISLYNPDEQIFICGDHIIKGAYGGLFFDAPLLGNKRAKPLLQYVEDLEKCRNISAKITYSGHGPDIDHLNTAIDAHILNIEKRTQRVISTLEKVNGVATGYEIIQDMYRGRLQTAIVSFIFEIIGVLDLLEEQNIVQSEKVNGISRYYLRKNSL